MIIYTTTKVIECDGCKKQHCFTDEESGRHVKFRKMPPEWYLEIKDWTEKHYCKICFMIKDVLE